MAHRFAILIVAALIAVAQWAGAGGAGALVCLAPCGPGMTADCCAPIPAPTLADEDCCAHDDAPRQEPTTSVHRSCCVRVPATPLVDPTLIESNIGAPKPRPILAAIDAIPATPPTGADKLVWPGTARPTGPPGDVQRMLRSTRLLV